LCKAVGERTRITTHDRGNIAVITQDTGKIRGHRQKYTALVTAQDRGNNLAQCHKFRKHTKIQSMDNSAG